MKKYKFRVVNSLEYYIDSALQPLMYFVGAKDAHWWDWQPYNDEVPNERLLVVNEGQKAMRAFPSWPIIGRYNPRQAISLFQTLFVLPDTIIVQPTNYSGSWSLISYKYHEEGIKSFYLSKFLVEGAAKNLSDGEVGYIGLSQEEEYIDLELVEICNRFEHRDLMFV